MKPKVFILAQLCSNIKVQKGLKRYYLLLFIGIVALLQCATLIMANIKY